MEYFIEYNFELKRWRYRILDGPVGYKDYTSTEFDNRLICKEYMEVTVKNIKASGKWERDNEG